MSLISIYTAICAALSAMVFFTKAASQDWVEQLRSSNLHPANTGATAPQIGGLIIIPVCLATAGIAWLLAGKTFFSDDIAILVGTTILCLTGFSDDRKIVSIKLRLAIQLFISLMLCLSLLSYFLAQLDSFYPSYHLIFSGTFLIIATLILIWSINSVNFIDGADLALVSNILPGIALVGLLIFDIWNDTILTLMASGLFGGLLVFSFFNKPPAKFYLGDAGSLPVGFVVGAIIVNGIARDQTFTALMPFTYIFVDTTFTFTTRILLAKNPLQSHSDHAYQRARLKGISAAQIALAMFLVSLANTMIAGFCIVLDLSFVGHLPFAVACMAISTGLFWWFHHPRQPKEPSTAT